MLTRNDYEQIASQIPSLGVGGITISRELMEYASKVKQENAIVELGPWLGSATSYLSIGSMFGNNAIIHSYDMWIASETYRHRAKYRNDLSLQLNEDLQPYFMKNLEGFKNIVPHKMSIFDINWDGTRVELLIVDMGNGKKHTDQVFEVFKNYFIPGKTIIFLMDYYFYTSRKALAYHYQKDLMEANYKSFQLYERPRRSRTAIFRYLGGEIRYVRGSSYHKNLNEGVHNENKRTSC
jgi:hypothetical protein